MVLSMRNWIVSDGRRRHPGMLESTTEKWGLIEVSVTRVPLHNQPDSVRTGLSFLDREIQDADKAKRFEELTEAEK